MRGPSKFRILGVATAGLLWLAGCASTSEGTTSTAPAEAPTATVAGVSPPAAGHVDRFAAAARYSEEHAGHGLLILEGEQVVYEAGQNGHLPNAVHRLNNASESFWGVLGVAADSDGLFDLDEPVTFTLPEFKQDPLKREIRLRHLLDYTSGLEPAVGILTVDRTPNLYARAIALGMVSPPGADFQYGPSHLYVFAEVLRRKLEEQAMDPLAYLQDRVLGPIDLQVAGWDRDQAGNPDVVYGAHLTAREWAKLGMLLNDDGLRDGETIIPAGDLRAAFRNRDTTPEFAVAMWRNPAKKSGLRTFFPGALPGLLVAAGADNQRLYVIPSRDMVIVRFGGPDRSWRDEDFIRKLLDASPPQS